MDSSVLFSPHWILLLEEDGNYSCQPVKILEHILFVIGNHLAWNCRMLHQSEDNHCGCLTCPYLNKYCTWISRVCRRNIERSMMDPDNKGHVSLSSKTYGCKQLTVLEVLRKLEQKLHTLYFIFDVALQFRNNDYGNNVNLEIYFHCNLFQKISICLLWRVCLCESPPQPSKKSRFNSYLPCNMFAFWDRPLAPFGISKFPITIVRVGRDIFWDCMCTT